MAVRVAEEWLHSCSGCEIAILNIGEPLIELLAELDFVHMPVLMDHKYFGQLGDGQHLLIPEADVGIVSGGCANEEHREVLEEMRKQCKLLIALGTCATHGGLPAMINSWGMEAAFEEAFTTKTTDRVDQIPTQDLPRPLDRVHALDEIVDIDLLVPGCPPNPEHIAAAIRALLSGEEVSLPSKSVCDTCPTKREGKGDIQKVRRFLKNAEFNPNKELDSMRCLLEQGFMCMGPVTAAGCARRGAPSCISARVPCRGCYGPVRNKGNQMLDMMNALASNAIDFTSVVDRHNLLRFSGSHNKLRK